MSYRSFTDPVAKTLRSLVSKDKYRFQAEGFDLDLTYITERIIAMGYPGEGIHSAYRNSVDEVSRFLNQYHHEHYRVFNVSEKMYEPNSLIKLGPSRTTFLGWPDHHAPSLERLIEVVLSMDDWLKRDPLNVAVVHCQAGRGRTGTVIAAYLLYIGVFTRAEDALHYFARERSSTGEGVNTPAQIRYVDYFVQIKGRLPPPAAQQEGKNSGFESIVDDFSTHHTHAVPTQAYFGPYTLDWKFPVKMLHSIIISPTPDYRPFVPQVEIYNTRKFPYKTLGNYTSRRTFSASIDNEAEIPVETLIHGDILIRIFTDVKVLGLATSRQLICRFAFNTMFMGSSTDGPAIYVLAGYEVEGDVSGPLKDTRFSPDVTFQLIFSDSDEQVISPATSPREEMHNNNANHNVDNNVHHNVESVHNAPPVDRAAKPNGYINKFYDHNNINNNTWNSVNVYKDTPSVSVAPPPVNRNTKSLNSPPSSSSLLSTSSFSSSSSFVPSSSVSAPATTSSVPVAVSNSQINVKEGNTPTSIEIPAEFTERVVFVDVRKSGPRVNQQLIENYFTFCGKVTSILYEKPYAVFSFGTKQEAGTAKLLNHGILDDGSIEVMTYSDIPKSKDSQLLQQMLQQLWFVNSTK